MKLKEATYFPDAEELTRFGFVEDSMDFINKLIGDDPLKADISDRLKRFGFDTPKMIKLLTTPEIKDVPETAVIIRTEKIKNGGTDENGKPMKDNFMISYKVPRRDSERGIKGVVEKLRNHYIKLFENHIVEGTVLNEDGEGSFAGTDGALSAADCNDTAPTDQPLFGMVRRKIGTEAYKNESKKMKRPIGRMTMYITEEQMKQLAQLIKEDEFGGGALTTSNVGVDGPNDWQYDVPFGAESKDDPAMDHSNLFDRDDENNKPTGHDGRHSQNESKSGIHIKKKNKGKFNATKKRTGKSTEELTHSKNPLTRKRAQFALNAAKWNKK